RRREKQMKRAQARLRRFMARTNVVDMDQEIRLLNADVMEQDKGLKAHRAKIAATQRKLDEVERQIAATPEQIPFAEEYLSNPTLLVFKQKLTELEVERIRLLEMCVPGARHVHDIAGRMGNVRGRTQEGRGGRLSE